MRSFGYTIEAKDAELANVLRLHANRCESEYMVRRTFWMLAWYYLAGYRRFNVFNPTTGKISPHFLDEEGNMEFQSQDLLFAINQVAGRIQSMDCRPKVESQGFSLDGLRNRSLSQIMNDSVVSDDQVSRVKEEFGWLFACLGFAGITGHVHDHPTIGLTADLEVIHPRDLFPFPLVGQDVTALSGIMRQRWIPMSRLRDEFGSKKISAAEDELEWYEATAGDMMRWGDEWEQVTYWSGKPFVTGPNVSGGGKSMVGYAKVRELWLYGPQRTCERYVIASGNKVLEDRDFKGMEVYCPIGWARFMNNGSFYGAGMFDLLYSVHRQLEQLSKNLYNNIIDIDRYGVLVLPQGEINKNQALRDVGRGLRVMFWEPDSMSDGFDPLSIQPFNTGDLPGRVAQFAREGMDKVNPIQDLIQEKGRVDSASGLQFLDEQITRALTSPTAGVTKAFGDCYRAITQATNRALLASKKALPVGKLTLDLAGAIIDPKTSSVSFEDNPLPDLSRLSFTIRSLSPRSTVARKMELQQNWQLKVEQDPTSYRLFALKEGLDVALWMDDVAGPYEAAIRDILALYGNGEEPGPITLTPHTTKPEIFLRVLEGFLCGPAMKVASPEVLNEFKVLRLTLLNFMGLTLPAAVPNPDDAAMLAMGGQQPQPQPPGTPVEQGPPQQAGPQPSTRQSSQQPQRGNMPRQGAGSPR